MTREIGPELRLILESISHAAPGNECGDIGCILACMSQTLAKKILIKGYIEDENDYDWGMLALRARSTNIHCANEDIDSNMQKLRALIKK